MGGELRQFPRIDKAALVSYEIVDAASRETNDAGLARTLDLSRKGLLLQITRSADIGDLVQLSLDVDDEIIDVEGEVVRVTAVADGYEVGVRLTSIDEEYEEVIESLYDEF